MTRVEVHDDRKAGRSNAMTTMPTEARGLGVRMNSKARKVATPSWKREVRKAACELVMILKV